MPNFLKRNLEIIQRRFPEIARMAETAPDSAKIEISKSGKPAVRIGSIALCSMRDPVKEAVAFVTGHNIEPGMCVAAYGIGLGYHIKPMLDAIGTSGKVVVAEANLAIQKAALTVIDDPDVLDDPRLHFVTGESEDFFLAALNAAFTGLDPEKTRIVIHLPSFQLLPEGYEKVARAIELIRMERRFPHVMGDIERVNFRRNLPKVLESPGILSLKGMLRGEAVTIVGAGPSLDRDIIHLGACGRGALFSSDTALPVLINAGITPDLVFSVDPLAFSYLHFEFAKRFDIPTVLLPTSNAGVVEKCEGNLYFGFKEPGRFPGIAKKWAETMGLFSTGGSVSCVALETALMVGAQTIVLLGQDFCFPQNRTYAKDSVFEILGGPMPDKESLTETKDHFGRKVKTSINLYSYQREFENLIERASVKAVTLSAEGPPMAGIEPTISPWPWIGQDERKPEIAPFPVSPALDPSIERAFNEWLAAS